MKLCLSPAYNARVILSWLSQCLLRALQMQGRLATDVLFLTTSATRLVLSLDNALSGLSSQEQHGGANDHGGVQWKVLVSCLLHACLIRLRTQPTETMFNTGMRFLTMYMALNQIHMRPGGQQSPRSSKPRRQQQMRWMLNQTT